MANTERLAALQKVRQARDAVDVARRDASLTPEALASLSRTYLDLDDLESQLILASLEDLVGSVERDAEDIEKVAALMRNDAGHLQQVSRVIDVAVAAVRGLVQVAGAAIKAGLV